jgi:ABC-type sugar transport system ATPase subunit
MAESSGAPLVEMLDITKSFGSVQALRGVSIRVYPGKILALVGDNGSGKTTLINILSGNIRPDSGTIVVEGKTYANLTPKLAMQAGISTVYQDLSLDDYRDAASNIFLGEELSSFGILRRAAMQKKAAELIDSLDIGIQDLTLPVSSYSGGQRQAVAVARAVHRGRKLVIFDEPTAAMGVRESAAVLQQVRRMADRGFGIIIISHNLHQVFSVADRICIMRHGRILHRVDAAGTKIEAIQQLIMEADTVD